MSSRKFALGKAKKLHAKIYVAKAMLVVLQEALKGSIGIDGRTGFTSIK